jgi:aminoglycoside/choline kinase family phosphotransferase
MADTHPLQDHSRWLRVEELAGDASTRRYSRLEDHEGGTVILAEYPDEVRRLLTRDLEVLQWLDHHGLRVPEVIDNDDGTGWILMEDFGSADGEQALRNCPAVDRPRLLDATIDPLVTLARLDPTELPTWNPHLDDGRMRWELASFELWFVDRLAGRKPSSGLGSWLDALVDEISSHPRRVCHRDYHLNNLFFLPHGEVGVIDVQDILVGPDTYDAVSLLAERDTPRLVDESQRHQWLTRWAQATGATVGWQERWPRVRLQRALKVLGTFARLTISGRPHYRAWLESLSAELVREAASLRLPPELTALLVDWQD